MPPNRSFALPYCRNISMDSIFTTDLDLELETVVQACLLGPFFGAATLAEPPPCQPPPLASPHGSYPALLRGPLRIQTPDHEAKNENHERSSSPRPGAEGDSAGKLEWVNKAKPRAVMSGLISRGPSLLPQRFKGSKEQKESQSAWRCIWMTTPRSPSPWLRPCVPAWIKNVEWVKKVLTAPCHPNFHRRASPYCQHVHGANEPLR
jgi:hypothetical protein